MSFDEALDDDVKSVVIPAQPGWFLCEPFIEGGVCAEVYEMPVVAWTVVTYGKFWKNMEGRSYAIPIVPEEPQPKRYALKSPKGTYDFPEGPYDVDLQEAKRLFNKGIV